MKSVSNLIKTRRRLTSLFSDFALSKNDRIKMWTGFRVASDQIRMSLTELGIHALVKAGEPLSYYTHFVNLVDHLMASPSDAVIAKWYLYCNNARQDSTETVTTRWRRIQRLGSSGFCDLCTWTEDQQEVALAASRRIQIPQGVGPGRQQGPLVFC